MLLQILPAVVRFQPDMIFISAGFDAHRKDDLNYRYIGIAEKEYEWVTDQIVQVANRCGFSWCVHLLRACCLVDVTSPTTGILCLINMLSARPAGHQADTMVIRASCMCKQVLLWPHRQCTGGRIPDTGGPGVGICTVCCCPCARPGGGFAALASLAPCRLECEALYILLHAHYKWFQHPHILLPGQLHAHRCWSDLSLPMPYAIKSEAAGRAGKGEGACSSGGSPACSSSSC